MDKDELVNQMASPGAPPEEVERIKALMCAPTETAIVPIKVVYDKRAGLGIFVGGALLEYAAVNGPFFNGEGLPSFKVTNLEEFVKAVGRALTSEREDGSTFLTEALDRAILSAVEGGCEGVDFAPPVPTAE